MQLVGHNANLNDLIPVFVIELHINVKYTLD
jgi:hypothetical protein